MPLHLPRVGNEVILKARNRGDSSTTHSSNSNDQPNLPVWKNNLSDIWFATKSGEFMFEQKPVSKLNSAENLPSNFWADMHSFGLDNGENQSINIPDEVIKRVLKASSFKLNWVLDPFARTGGTGIVAKKMGRRFIGFEVNKDKLILAMKRIDSEEK